MNNKQQINKQQKKKQQQQSNNWDQDVPKQQKKNQNQDQSDISDYEEKKQEKTIEQKQQPQQQQQYSYNIQTYQQNNYKDEEIIVQKANAYDDTQQIDQFENMELKDDVLQSIYKMGFTKPSQIQQKAIPLILSGKDVIAQAQSGQGKTCSFIIPSLQFLQDHTEHVQILILCPTRELVDQIYDVYKLMEYNICKPIKSSGGLSLREEKQSYSKKLCNVVIGTPGRLSQVITDKLLDLGQLRLLIVDEVDEILQKGFQEETKKIIQNVSKDSQVAFFSATISQNVVQLSQTILNENHVQLFINRQQVNVQTIKHYYQITKGNQKFQILYDILQTLQTPQTIVFCNKVSQVEQLYGELINLDVQCDFIHGNVENQKRKETLQNFKQGQFRILITSDLLQRGIDIQQVQLVINYDIPFYDEQFCEKYIHRVGRAGRFGREGIAVNIIHYQELQQLNRIAQKYDIYFQDFSTLGN